uniref:Tetraspanin n=1 Tax=Clastoptera arizonana TaxID=38151 RepID=A0A1B6CBG6_9HEMI
MNSISIEVTEVQNNQMTMLVRYIVIGFNVLLGLLALTIAASSFNHPAAVVEELIPTHSLLTPTWVVLVAFLLLIAVGIGIYSTITSVYYFLLFYLMILVGVIIFEVFLGFGMVYEAPLYKDVKNTMDNGMENYHVNNTHHFWDGLQKELKCCGIAGPTDWFATWGEQRLPQSCCVHNSTQFHHGLCMYDPNPARVYQSGCYLKAISVLERPLIERMVGLGIALQIIQLINIVFVAILLYMVKNRENQASWSPKPTNNVYP